MKINALYRKYFQKSKIFLYPLLDIKRGTSVVPSHTFVAWNDTYKPEDMKLICLYETRLDKEYINFEKNVLLKHNRLHDYVKIDAEQSVFIFDFSDYANDWMCFLNGSYSKLDSKTKIKILDFFEKNSGNYVYINSYLNPENWFERYAELLGVEKEMLEKVGELCSKPDLSKEILLFVVADLENIEILD
jgi:hypothetical protein